MQYRLRTLLVALTVCPPLLAVAWWTVQWSWSYPVVPILLAYLAAAVFGPLACYRELITLVCGPDPTRPVRRKSRHKVRVRIERYAGSS